MCNISLSYPSEEFTSQQTNQLSNKQTKTFTYNEIKKIYLIKAFCCKTIELTKYAKILFFEFLDRYLKFKKIKKYKKTDRHNDK